MSLPSSMGRLKRFQWAINYMDSDCRAESPMQCEGYGKLWCLNEYQNSVLEC